MVRNLFTALSIERRFLALLLGIVVIVQATGIFWLKDMNFDYFAYVHLLAATLLLALVYAVYLIQVKRHSDIVGSSQFFHLALDRQSAAGRFARRCLCAWVAVGANAFIAVGLMILFGWLKG